MGAGEPTAGGFGLHADQQRGLRGRPGLQWTQSLNVRRPCRQRRRGQVHETQVNTSFPSESTSLWYSSSILLSVASSLYSLSLSLFAQLWTLASSVFQGWARRPWGRNPFSTSDLQSGTPPPPLSLSLSGILL